MRICIYGAGSIGAYIGSELSLSGADVTLIARGQHFEAMRSKGLRVRIGSEEKISYPKCVSNPDEAGKQDYVFITLKTHSSAKSATFKSYFV